MPRPVDARAAVVSLVLALAVVAAAVAVVGRPAAGKSSLASAPGWFLARYELPDGRVVRSDQGGDTVSEGQAYAMAVALGVGDRSAFQRAWRWSLRNLMQPDGLLAWHWAAGRVVGSQPAADADVMVAASLIEASKRFSAPAHAAAGRAMAGRIAAAEVVATAAGPVLTGGPWATKSPWYVNSSYLALLEWKGVGSALGASWRGEVIASRRVLAQSMSGGALPTDWSVVGEGGVPSPASPPGSPGTRPAFGFDAARVPLWLVGSCSAGDRRLAASLLPALRRGGGELELDRRGAPSPGVATPVGLVAEAASERAAGNRGTASRLITRALLENRARPTYYASGLLALAAMAFRSGPPGC